MYEFLNEISHIVIELDYVVAMIVFGLWGTGLNQTLIWLRPLNFSRKWAYDRALGVLLSGEKKFITISAKELRIMVADTSPSAGVAVRWPEYARPLFFASASTFCIAAWD